MDIHIIPVNDGGGDDKFIIYRPLSGIAFVGNRAMANLAQKVETGETLGQSRVNENGETWAFLRRVGFLQPDPPEPAPISRTFLPTMAVLLMSNQCQLRCTYCYASAGDLPAEELTREQGYGAINFVCQNAMELNRPRFEISFHGGGEPTFAWSILKDCVAYAREQPLPAQISLTTNGVWSRQQRDWIVANIDGLTLSFDGTAEIQNRQRPFASGIGSADIVMGNMAELDRCHYPYSIRMTATDPWEDFLEGVRFICQETGCQSIQVEPAFNTKRGGHSYPDNKNCQAFAGAFMEALDIARTAGRRLMYSGARLGLVTTTFCTAPYNALIISPSGRLVTCYEVTDIKHPLASLSTMGRLENGNFSIDQNSRDLLHSLMHERRQGCQDCFCYWSCAGDCYTRTFQMVDDGHQIRAGRCTMNREITRRMLLNGIADGDGIWWRQPLPAIQQEIPQAIPA